MDRIVIAGWCLLLLLGQVVLPFECRPLEWLALAWMGAGLLLVRRAATLPLLLLTCPVFQCEPHRAWAWAQPLFAAVLLGRIVCGGRLGRGGVLWVVFWGMVVAWASWPVEAGELLVRLRAFPRRELLTQWLRPEASWSIFPFRATADRALVAALCAALVQDRRYVSTSRLWRALFGMGLLALVTAETAIMSPWYQAHRFLGTTNYAVFGPYLLHGAGYNAAFLPIVLAAALPWFVVPLRRRWRWWHVGLLTLLPPLWFLIQRSMALLVVLLPVVAGGLIAQAGLIPRLRPRLRSRAAAFWRSRRGIFAVALLGLGFTADWFYIMGVTRPASHLQQKILSDLRTGNLRGSVSAVPCGPTAGTDTEGSPSDAAARPATSLDRLQRVLARVDPARAHMWALGLRQAWHKGFWHGAGAGTWARFHRAQPRPSRLYFAHMHNTYLDLVFEYGVVPTAILYGAVLVTLIRLGAGRTRLPRVWLLYFAGLAIVALGQHLFFSFFSFCLLIPGILVLVRAWPPRPALR